MTFSHGIPIWQVDAFADRPFTGNPAAVCLLKSFPPDDWMQQVAAEMNLAETAFVVPTDQADSFQLRWFTPETEVDLCGHATLAAAHTLREQGKLDANGSVRFQTRSGELSCLQADSRITLDFPSTPAGGDVDADIARRLRTALGVDEADIFQSPFDLLVVVGKASIVESLRPNFNVLETIETRGVIVSARTERGDIDFISRFFAPRCGINEDPVTGSAHCCLAPFWAARLGKQALVGYQASRRGGTVHCTVQGPRVHLTGTAVTVMEGRFVQLPD